MQALRCTALALAIGAFMASPAQAQQAGYALLVSDNQIAFAVDGQAQSASMARPVLGIELGEQLVAIDVRPQNGRLYGLSHNPALGAVRLYHIELAGSAIRATAVGSTGSFVDGTGLPLMIQAQGFNIDFNPTVDRLRVVTTGGLNFRMNPNNGALIDGDFGNPGAPTAGVNPDGNLSMGGNSSGATGTAYANSVINTAITTQYSLNHETDSLYIQNPPNAGVLTAPLPIRVGGAVLNFGAASGLDIEQGVDAPASNAPASGSAVAVLSVAGQSQLYRIDLATGNATLQGALGGLNVLDIAVMAPAPTANVLNLNGDRLGRFTLGDPATVGYANISGVVAGERLVGIDIRPTTGQLYALGINAEADTGTLYLLEPQSAGGAAAATAVGTPGQIRYVDGNGVAIDLSDLPAGFDFNPTVDRVRFMDASGLNARINPITGAPVDGDPNLAGTNPDGSVQAELGTQIVGTAYTSSFPNAGFTTQYTLDQGFGRLSIQNPPNAGVQSQQLAVTLDGAAFEFAGGTGFDIPPGVASASANQAVTGEGYFTANDAEGAPSLYSISLGDASVALLGAVDDAGDALNGLAVSDSPAAIGTTSGPITAPRGGSARIRVFLLGGSALPVHLRAMEGTAVAGQDFSASRSTLLVNGASPSAEIEIPILGSATPGRSFTVIATGPFAAPVQVQVFITEDADAIFKNGFETL